MKAPVRAALAATLLTHLALSFEPSAATTDPDKPAASSAAVVSSRRMLFTYEAMFEKLPADRNVFDLWVPLPSSSPVQKISDLVIYSPGDAGLNSEPEYGNQMAHVRLGPRGGIPVKVTVRFTAERFADLHPDLSRRPAVPETPPANLDRYLKSDRLVPIDEETKTIARRIVQGKTTPLDKAHAIYEWILSFMKYDKSGEGWGQGDLRYALTMRRGNSIDLNTAFTGLARAVQIPARIVFGFKIPRGLTEANLMEYHCWSEFWLEGFGWLPVDPVEGMRNANAAAANFGSVDANRIAFSAGRDVGLVPPQNADPINFILYPYAEGDGQALTGNAYRFSFKDDPGKRPAASPAAAASGPAAPPASPSPGMGRPDPNAPPRR